ncbi:hypothetical protein ACFYVR_21790 [Rhodococcus sp. NPDC003318]|uniref:hypothetical protein n=1 Tax=Rhodococcus sp. NPDC003318 TaxID=3364503 RepID=UPI0036BFAD89
MSADQRETADALVVLHGVDALVHEALRRHRPADPARFASAWIKAWLDLPAPTPAAAALCGRCDQGWLDEDMDGRGVKCPCHSARATVTA